MEVISRSGRHPLEWLYLLCVGHLGSIAVMWDSQVLELADSRIWSFSICCKFTSLEDNFE